MRISAIYVAFSIVPNLSLFKFKYRFSVFHIASFKSTTRENVLYNLITLSTNSDVTLFMQTHIYRYVLFGSSYQVYFVMYLIKML